MLFSDSNSFSTSIHDKLENKRFRSLCSKTFSGTMSLSNKDHTNSESSFSDFDSGEEYLPPMIRAEENIIDSDEFISIKSDLNMDVFSNNLYENVLQPLNTVEEKLY